MAISEFDFAALVQSDYYTVRGVIWCVLCPLWTFFSSCLGCLGALLETLSFETIRTALSLLACLLSIIYMWRQFNKQLSPHASNFEANSVLNEGRDRIRLVPRLIKSLGEDGISTLINAGKIYI